MRSETNFRGRFEYLEAAREHWPELLVSLREDAGAPFAAFMCLRSTEPPATYSGLCEQGEDAALRNLCSALDRWALSHRIRDEWILDAAVQTLAAWWRNEQIRAAEAVKASREASEGNGASDARELTDGIDEKRWFYTPEPLGVVQSSLRDVGSIGDDVA